MPCELCIDPSLAGEIVYEDDTLWIILHHDWSPAGHALVVSKEHVENASDLAPGKWQHFTAKWREAERVILDATGTERAIILKLGIKTPHLHLHIYPMMATHDRRHVFDAFDEKVRSDRDPALVQKIRTALAT